MSARDYRFLRGAAFRWKPTRCERKFDAWWPDYNLHRPHSALGQLSPAEYLNRRIAEDEKAASVLI